MDFPTSLGKQRRHNLLDTSKIRASKRHLLDSLKRRYVDRAHHVSCRLAPLLRVSQSQTRPTSIFAFSQTISHSSTIFTPIRTFERMQFLLNKQFSHCNFQTVYECSFKSALSAAARRSKAPTRRARRAAILCANTYTNRTLQKRRVARYSVS